MGIIDAHPGSSGQRPKIEQLIAGRKVLFACLTHPHADHGVDLIPVLEKHPDVNEFWYTVFDVPALVYGVEQTVNFPSPVREFAAKMNQDWGEFLCDLFAAVALRKIARHLLRSDVRERVIDGVEVHCLGPDESIQNRFTDAYKAKLSNPVVDVPDPNSLSAILALKFGPTVVLLGADALKKNWDSAVRHYRSRALPKASVLKVPHHGARNSFNFDRHGHESNYLDLCSHSPRAKAVIFGGDAKHPDLGVYAKLRNRADTFCLSNGTRAKSRSNSNPLRLQIPGARVAHSATICNPVVSFELDERGGVGVAAGVTCESCPQC